jgi:hypothetical protein
MVVPTPSASGTNQRPALAASKAVFRSSARTEGRSDDTAAIGAAWSSSRTRSAAYRNAALSPASGASGMTSAPSSRNIAPTGSLVTTTTRSTCEQETAAETVSWAKATANLRRVAGSKPVSRLFAMVVCLTGMMMVHAGVWTENDDITDDLATCSASSGQQASPSHGLVVQVVTWATDTRKGGWR